MKRQSILALTIAILVFSFVSTSFGTLASFQGIGALKAYAVSTDGSVVVGHTVSASVPPDVRNEAFRWTASGGIENLGDLSGGSFDSWAFGVSADGSVVVGRSNSGSGQEAFRWENGVMTGIGDLPGGNFYSEASSVSADGSVVVGMSSGPDNHEAFRWTAFGGMEPLGDLPGGDFYSYASAVSADGSVVVGFSTSESGIQEAFRWTPAGGMEPLGDLPGGKFYSEAYGISADGSVIVGRGHSLWDDGFGYEAFRWTADGGMQGLGQLPGGRSSNAWAASDNGSVVVGYSTITSYNEAFIWDGGYGMRSLKDVLENDCGLVLDGWHLTVAKGISADGLTIVGYGTNPDGNTEAWIATVPEPVTLLLLGFGGLALLRRRRA